MSSEILERKYFSTINIMKQLQNIIIDRDFEFQKHSRYKYKILVQCRYLGSCYSRPIFSLRSAFWKWKRHNVIRLLQSASFIYIVTFSENFIWFYLVQHFFVCLFVVCLALIDHVELLGVLPYELGRNSQEVASTVAGCVLCTIVV